MVTIEINGIYFSNTLIYIGASISVIIVDTM
jgi:hypothetical protein